MIDIDDDGCCSCGTYRDETCADCGGCNCERPPRLCEDPPGCILIREAELNFEELG